jgi:hypothetical protein
MSVASSELGRFEPVADVVVLAAVERAVLHYGRPDGVPLWNVAEHLGFRSGSWTTRRLRPQLEALRTEGLLTRSRRRGLDVWALSGKGGALLASARVEEEMVELPESPQHRLWRHLRAEAGGRIDRFDGELGEALVQAEEMRGREWPSSDEWFELAERLHRLCRGLGGMTYCLREWAEPQDVRPDRDKLLDPDDERLPPAAQQHLRILRSGRRRLRDLDEHD